MKFAKLLLAPYARDSRSQRECSVVHSLGVPVCVVDVPDCAADVAMVPSAYEHVSLGGDFSGGVLRRLPSFFRCAWRLRGVDYDVLSCYDVSALLVGWLCNLLRGVRRRAVLVYDAHEYEAGRNTRRGVWVTRLVVRVEGFLMRRVRASLMVNDTIAAAVQRLHGLRVRPYVVRNVPPHREVDWALRARLRADYLSLYAEGVRGGRLLLYHGALMRGRGCEEAIRSLEYLPDCLLLLLGDGDGDYLSALRALAGECGVWDRLSICAGVPYGELIDHVASCDISLVNIDNICESYYYSLPNKLFEAIQAERPVVVSDFPELSRIVDEYGVGVKYSKSDAGGLVRAVRRLLDDASLYDACVRNTVLAKESLCWERESAVLRSMYVRIFNDRDGESV